MNRRILPYFGLALTTFLFHCHGQQGGKDNAFADGPMPVKKPAEIPFKHQSFTFVRVRYSSDGPWAASMWMVDYPDSDRNFSARFQKETGLKTDLDGRVLALTDPQLKQYPFIYVVEPGRMNLLEPEVQALRTYLLGGGFLMVDDFWGDPEWANFYAQIKRVVPNHEPVELPIEHPVFHCFSTFSRSRRFPTCL